MKKFLIFSLFALMMVACLPVPAANLDTGDQVAYCVDQISDLPVVPVISEYIALENKCLPVKFIDANIPTFQGPSICLDNPPQLMYICGVDADASNITLKGSWDWLQANWWWIASALLTISEGLGLTKKIESNSILQLLFGWVKKKAVKPPE